MTTDHWPTFAMLRGENMPDGASWGVFGPDDQLGTLNFIDDDAVRFAAGLVRQGRVIPLSLPHTYFEPPFNPERHNATHTVFATAMTMDDRYDSFFPQGASQWDALRHVQHPKWGFYNRQGPVESDNDVLSIAPIARRGIATRGVMIDVAGYRERQGIPIDPRGSEPIPLTDLQACLKDQGTTLRQGDIILVRTGWLAFWKASGRLEPRPETMRCPGVSNDPAVTAWLWDNRVAAIVADNIGLEPSPLGPGRSLHIQLLAYLGMPIGEFWDLEALSAHCAESGQYDFQLCSAPLDLPGACGSPAAALAIT